MSYLNYGAEEDPVDWKVASKRWQPRRCGDGLVHLVVLEELRRDEPRRWLRFCDMNDDDVKVTSLPVPEEAVTCIACNAHTDRAVRIASFR